MVFFVVRRDDISGNRSVRCAVPSLTVLQSMVVRWSTAWPIAKVCEGPKVLSLARLRVHLHVRRFVIRCQVLLLNNAVRGSEVDRSVSGKSTSHISRASRSKFRLVMKSYSSVCSFEISRRSFQVILSGWSLYDLSLMSVNHLIIWLICREIISLLLSGFRGCSILT